MRLGFWRLRNTFLGLLLLILPGCAALAVDPYQAADQLAAARGFSKRYLEAGAFRLLSYQRFTAPGQAVTVYLEGDGAAWLTRSRISTDPTPRQPLVLELAALDPAANVAYLARPCQFVLREGLGEGCEPALWSSARFGEAVVESLDRGLDSVLLASGAAQLHLIGYSGGGALAVLAAARRDDVVSLRTIAGNLDHRRFTGHHRVTPLRDSLNPSDMATVVDKIPQLHFVGGEDAIVPALVAESFLNQQGPANCAELVRVEGVGHQRGWLAVWPDLLRTILPCSAEAGP
ncbi:MAG TPA: hypothetical protein VLA15_09170 [Desulfurivibrionaceae bacterium]|nr:hypothetical protein [Desulfurivibrionaceae bacterium]